MPRNGITFNGKRVPNILTLFNTQGSTRILQVNGLGSKDIMVGTPDVSDILSGSAGGGDTFVVGGGSILVNFTSGSDQIIVDVPTTTEQDVVILTAGAAGVQEYIYINTDLQRTGGTFMVSPAASGVPFWGQVPVLGGNSLQSLMPFAATAQQCISGVLSPPVAGFSGPGSALLTASKVSSPMPSSGGIQPAGQAVPRVQGGAPILRNFVMPVQGPGANARSDKADLIILSAEEVRNPVLMASRHLLDSHSKRQPIPIYDVRSINVLTPKSAPLGLGAAGGKQEAAGQSTDRTGKIGPGIPLPLAPTDRYSFFYFSKNGLLVYSANDQPLASAANPGRVIAQLVGPDGEPAKLPIASDSLSEGAPVIQASFLSLSSSAVPDKPAKDGRGFRSIR